MVSGEGERLELTNETSAVTNIVTNIQSEIQ